MKRKLFISAIAVLLLAVGATAASAHTVLIASSPIKNSTLSHLPTKIRLTFADPLLTLGKNPINQVVVTDPMNMVISNSANVVKGAVLTNTITDQTPVSGKYEVTYRVSAQDGHIVTGKFFFTLKN